jgi:hypothetical protein
MFSFYDEGRLFLSVCSAPENHLLPFGTGLRVFKPIGSNVYGDNN